MSENKENQKPKVHKELEDFNINIDPFGKIGVNYDTDKLNEFLNKKVKDKKFRGIPDLEDKYEDDGSAQTDTEEE